MPTVPTYGNERVSESALPSVRFSVPNDIEAFGGGSTQKTINTALSILQEEKRKADDVATTEAYSKLSRLKNDLIYNPKDGLNTRQGKNAFGAFDEFGSRFDKGADEIEKSLSNEDQKLMFRKMKLKEKTEFDGGVQRHVYQESVRFDNETTKSALSASLDDAVKNYQSPGKIQESIQLQKALIQANADRNGLPQEQLKAQLVEVESQTHKSVINRMLANGQDILAKEYFNGIKKKVTGSDSTEIERSLQTGTIKGESQRQTDRIMSSAGTVTEALAEARKIQDSDIRDSVVNRVKSRFAELKALEKKELDESYLQATEYLKTNSSSQPIDVIPPSLFSKLTADQKRALYSYNIPGTDDANSWVSFLELSPQEMATLSLSDFQTQYWAGLNQEHRKQATDLWNTAKKNTDDAKLNGLLSDKARIKNTLISTGLYDVQTKGRRDKVRLIQFENAVDKQFQDFERSKGRKPYPEETQKMIDDLITKKVFVEDAVFMFFDKEKRIVELSESDRNEAYVPMKDIPQTAIDRIKGMAKQRGVALTKDKIQKIYAAAIIGNDDRIEELLR